MSKFQIIILAAFGACIIIAVAVFALYRGANATNATVTIWGSISSRDMGLLLSNPIFNPNQTVSVNYVEKSADTLEAEFTEALAQGTGPDLIITTTDKFWKNRPKLMPIPYTNISERNFKTTFIEEGELFLDPTGMYALPLSLDPLVLYYNRDLLSAVGQAKPLSYWDEIYAAALKLSKKDAAGNITQSVMALGEARNIPNAKDIISLLLLQAGTPVTDFLNSKLRSEIANNFDLPVSPGESAFDFYTQFSNPTKAFYSWNRSLVDAQTNFTSGDSAYYLGFASEYRTLRNKNPNLNFAVAPVPQSRVSGKVITFGRLMGVAISRSARNPSAALSMATKLISKDSSLFLSKTLFLPPARRDLFSERPLETVLSIFYDAALQSKAWLDPDVSATGNIFREAIESITSGRVRTLEAVNKASREIDALIK